MEWRIEDYPPELLAAVAIGGAAFVFLLLIGIVLARRKRRLRSDRSMAQRRVKSAPPAPGPDQIISAYRASHPSFYRIMKSFEGRRLDELLQSPEVSVAFQKLMSSQPKPARKKDVGSSVLQLSSPVKSPEVNAAIVTILRHLYLNAEYRKELDPGAEAELDRLLESLTE